MQFIRIFLLASLVLGVVHIADAQLSLETFGKNRVQHRKFDWRYFESERFRVYYYDRGGAELARFVAEQANQDVRAVERTLNSNFPPMLNIILYNNYSDYLQSNVDYNTELEISDPYAGNVKIAGDKLVIYFSGQHSNLKNQLRRGMAQVILERALFGDDVKSFARNALSQKVPTWLSRGYVEYTVFGWDSEAEEQWKQYLQKEDTYFASVIRDDEPLAGRAFWKYIASRYGKNEVRNLFFLTLQKNNLANAIKSKYQMRTNALLDSAMQFYRERYAFEKMIAENPSDDSALFVLSKARPDIEIIEIKVSPRGSDIAYVEWERGEYRVILERTNNARRSEERTKGVIFSGGIVDFTAEADPDYPLLAWSNTGFKLGIIYPKRGKLYIRIYDAVKGEFFNYEIRYNRFDRIQGFTFMEDDEMIVLSAIRNGQSDLYEYRYRFGRYTQLTDDTYDDLSPVFISGGARKGIAFLSNRVQPYTNIRPLPNELPTQPLNAFFYFHTTRSEELLQLTKVKDENLQDIIPYGQDHYAYLSDRTGIKNRYIVLFGRDARNRDTAYSVPVTNYSSNIISQQYNAASGKIAEVIQEGDEYKIYFRKIELPQPLGPAEIKEPIFIRSVEEDDAPAEGTESLPGYRPFEVRSGTDFITEFTLSAEDTQQIVPLREESVEFARQMEITSSDPKGYDTTKQYVLVEENSIEGKQIVYVDSTFIKLRSNPYQRAFHTTSFSAHLDNSLVFNRYQSYSGNFGSINNPELGGMLTMVMKDRLEDHRFTGGLRVNPDFTMGYLMKYENLKRRLDWNLTGFMQNAQSITMVGVASGAGVVGVEVPTKHRMSIFQAGFSYPLNRVQSIRAQLSLREDRTVLKANEYIGLLIPDLLERYTMGRLEWVHDDTRAPALNIFNGLRYKVYGEYLYKFQVENEHYGDRNGTVNNTLGGFYNFGFDARYYRPIYRDFIFAARVAGAHAGGNQQIMYVMGGVDNEFSPQYNTLLQPTLTNTYAFQALTTNLRGYKQNSRNGNTFFLANLELRLPVVTTFSNKTILSSFFKNLQVVGFVDIGSAWEGLIPDDNLHRNNRFYYPNQFDPQIEVVIPYPLPNQLALGYGLGLRMYVYSYFLRVDFARNIENRGQIHFSLGYDF